MIKIKFKIIIGLSFLLTCNLQAEELKACVTQDGAIELAKEAEGHYLRRPDLYLSKNKEAFEMGLVSAADTVGYIYRKGFSSIKQDTAKSKEWYLKSANKGFHSSMFTLADMYEKGEGTDRDLKSAYAWTYIAKKNIPDFSNSLFSIFKKKKYTKFLLKLKTKMSNEEIKKAIALSKELEANFSCSYYEEVRIIHKKENFSKQEFDNEKDNIIEAVLNYDQFVNFAPFVIYVNDVTAYKAPYEVKGEKVEFASPKNLCEKKSFKFIRIDEVKYSGNLAIVNYSIPQGAQYGSIKLKKEDKKWSIIDRDKYKSSSWSRDEKKKLFKDGCNF